MSINFLKSIVRAPLRAIGYDLVAYEPERVSDTIDLEAEDAETGIISRVAPYTMTSSASVSAFCHAVRYVQSASIEGAIVECGVWKGGSMMAAALELLRIGAPLRHLVLCDTYEGLPDPGVHDVARGGLDARAALRDNEDTDGKWCRSPLDEVRANLQSTGYPQERISYVQGMVEDTLPGSAPDNIAVLRLDTDFYESTRHELIHLYPRLAVGGILIIDDYGYWQGARKAVDEFNAQLDTPFFLCRVDHAVRLAIKPGP